MKTPITYYGGKQRLATFIIGMMPSHKNYVEPFFGGGAVFFAKGKSFLEVINDKNDTYDFPCAMFEPKPDGVAEQAHVDIYGSDNEDYGIGVKLGDYVINAG